MPNLPANMDPRNSFQGLILTLSWPVVLEPGERERLGVKVEVLS